MSEMRSSSWLWPVGLDMRLSWWPVGRDNYLALLMGLLWSAAATAAAAAADIVALSLPKYHLHSCNKKANSITSVFHLVLEEAASCPRPSPQHRVDLAEEFRFLQYQSFFRLSVKLGWTVIVHSCYKGPSRLVFCFMMLIIFGNRERREEIIGILSSWWW